MSDQVVDYAVNSSFDINDYVDASNDAAKRTRTVTIILVVASVLIFIGFYNSARWSWALDRIRRAYDPAEESVLRALDTVNRPGILTEVDKQGYTPAENFRTQLQQATVRAYVENIRFVRVPFFGNAFDVNDLGTIGGIGLIIVLLLMRYSLSREIKNLNISFREAVHHNRLCAFYHALAMRQVFTVPHMKGEKRNALLATSPKIVCILPSIIFSLGVSYDYFSVFYYGLFSFKEVPFTLITGTVWLLVIWLLSLKCWERQSHINKIWDEHWDRIECKNSPVIRLEKELIEAFGNDDAANGALRNLLAKPAAPADGLTRA
jgi:hypothetical protein